MPAWKMTLLFQALSKAGDPNYPIHRIGGWSESWYSTISADTAKNRMLGGGTVDANRASVLYRSRLLGTGASIVGWRLQQVDPVGGSQTGFLSIPGKSGFNQDIPQMGLLCRAPSIGKVNVKRFILRGIPDAVVEQGEYTPDSDYKTDLANYFNDLQFWCFRGRDLSQAAVKVFKITTAGIVTTEAPHGAAINDMVRVMRTTDSGGELRSARKMVTAVGPGTNSLTLDSWEFGATTGGTIRKDAIVYPAVDSANTAFSRIVTRRVGRPFTGYRGRQSSRRG